MITTTPTLEFWMRRVSWCVMSVSVLAICFYSAGYFLPDSVRPDVYPSSGFTWLLLVHIGGGIIAALAGPLQFCGRFRRDHTQWHRRLGFCYLFGVGIGAPAALIIAPASMGGLTAHVGFSLLAILWAATTITAYVKIINKDWQSHREWMIRSYALVLAFVSLRILLGLIMLTGTPFEQAFQTVAWLCWVPNLIIAELYIQRQANTKAAS